MSDKTSVKNIFNAEDARLENAKLSASEDVSFVGEEPDTGDFVVTLDRAKFDNPVSIVSKVLQAKGYTVNLENMLAMLDQFQIGIRADVEDGEHPPHSIENYNYCFKLSKPDPQIQGSLIKIFYTEVKRYQKEILKLKTEVEEHETKAKTQTVKELRDEIKRLNREVSDLTNKNKVLNQKLENSVSSSIRSIGNQQKSWSLDIGELRLAKLKSVDLISGQLDLRVSSSSFQFDLAKLDSVPKIGTNCIAHIVEGTVERLFPLDDDSEPFDLVLSTVLMVSKDGIKVRDADRNILIIKLKSFEDFGRAEELTRGMPVLLYKYQRRIIKWVSIKEKKYNFELKMEEALLRFDCLKVKD